MHLSFNSRNLEECAQMLEMDRGAAEITPRETAALVRIMDATALKLLASAYYTPEEAIEEPQNNLLEDQDGKREEDAPTAGASITPARASQV